MPGDQFGQIQNQKPLDLAYLDHSGQWQVLHYPTSGTPSVLFAGGPAPPARTEIIWQSRATLYGATDITVASDSNVTPNAITNASLANRTRTCWISAAGDWTIDTGTPDLASRGSAGTLTKVPAWAFDGAAREAITTTFYMPADWDSGPITLNLYWAPSTGGAGNVFWDVDGAGLASGQQIDQTPEFDTQAVSGAPGVAEQLTIWTSAAFTPDAPLVRFIVIRLADIATDTYDAADAWFVGLKINYTADS